ncbi:ribosomal RNA-processing protein 14 [Podospora fimiseda]|uniref:Ribosomal RNA-processing protein 14 n=1 Tax=Podospora fimiseda TaxID=252190 RepID=A0AAN7BZV3_9PEZI|nr:ribosomal RNA-processing protein 14 [Podospora fimiseda]
MADNELKDRLRDYTNSFNGLLSLIPAKMYYGEDTSDQWKKKKQTKEEARAAKRGKLDPDSELHKNAKEVLEERARNKRKAQELDADDDSDENSGDDEIDLPDIEKEKPREGLVVRKKVKGEDEESEEADEQEKEEAPAPKKQKVEEESTVEQTPNKKLSAKEQKEAKKSTKKQKKEEAKRLKMEAAAAIPSKKAAPAEKKEEQEKPEIKESTEVDNNSDRNDDDMAPIDVSGLVSQEDESSADSNSARDSPLFDTSAAPKTDGTEEAPASAATSLSSAVPPSEKPKYLKIPVDAATQAKLRARLDAKLGQFKQQRKAVDPEGKPVKTRTELIEARRIAELKRKEHKKEMRKLAKIEEEKKREETLASARNSPALSSLLAGGDDDKANNHFSFGRLAFNDGTTLSHDASYEKTPGSAKKKGPSDPKTALLKLENQKKRLAALDEEKRKDIEEKETWLAARKRAEGEKVVDNENLLKKALKRKEKAKKKSEKEWKDRAEGVTKAIYDRQKKREANLQKRKDDKMSKKLGGKKKKNSGVQTKSKSRPGFEGGFGRK